MNKIEKVTQEDIRGIAELEECCFLDPWTEKGIQDVYEGDFYLMYKVKENKQIAGYIIGRCVVDEGELLRVGVAPEFRQNSYGKLLVKKLKQSLLEHGANVVYLEVRESNESARALYEKMKFKTLGVRKNYYQHPMENAIIMEWKEKEC